MTWNKCNQVNQKFVNLLNLYLVTIIKDYTSPLVCVNEILYIVNAALLDFQTSDVQTFADMKI